MVNNSNNNNNNNYYNMIYSKLYIVNKHIFVPFGLPMGGFLSYLNYMYDILIL